MNLLKNQLLTGIIIGVVLTFIGTFIQFELTKKYQENRENDRLGIMTSTFLQSRLRRSNSIIKNSGSPLFKDRWNSYVYEVIYPWNANLFLMESFVKQAHPELSTHFDRICELFYYQHTYLDIVRKKQGAILSSSRNELSNAIIESENLSDSLSPLIKDVTLGLMK